MTDGQARSDQLFAILDEACEKASVGGEGALVLVDATTNEAHVIIRMDGAPEPAHHVDQQIAVAQKALYALAAFIQHLEGGRHIGRASLSPPNQALLALADAHGVRLRED